MKKVLIGVAVFILITTFSIIVYLFMGNDINNSSPYAEGEIIISFKNKNITPDQIYAFLQEQDLQLTKSSVERLNKPIGIPIRFTDIAPERDKSEIESMYRKISSAPFVEGVSFKVSDSNESPLEDMQFFHGVNPKFIVTYNAPDIETFASELSSYAPELAVIPQEFLRNKYIPAGKKYDPDTFYDIGDAQVKGKTLLRNDQAVVIWDKATHIELLQDLIAQPDSLVQGVSVRLSRHNNIRAGIDYDIDVDSFATDSQIDQIFEGNSTMSAGYNRTADKNEQRRYWRKSFLTVIVPKGKEREYSTKLGQLPEIESAYPNMKGSAL